MAQTNVELDGAKFTKLCRDCNLIDRSSLTSTDIDIVFAKVALDAPPHVAGGVVQVKTKGMRKINYPQFERALTMIAEKKGMEPEALRNLLCASEGPKTNATKAAYVKFYDDKKLYTGVHKRKSAEGSRYDAHSTAEIVSHELSKQTSAKYFR